MSVWESNTPTKNFDEAILEIEKLKKFTLQHIAKVEAMANLQKIQQFKPLELSKIQINKREDSSWYSKSEYIRIDISESVNKQLGFPVGLTKVDSSYGNTAYKLVIKEENTELLKEAEKIILRIAEIDELINKENLEIRKSNQETSTALFSILKQVGIRESYSGFKSNRSTKRTDIYYSFPSEIRNQIPTHYSENNLNSIKEEKIRQLKGIWNSAISKVREERIKKEKEEKEKKENKVLALLLSKYDLSLEDTWEDIQEVLLNKNKYLKLAHFLQMNRNDWTEGYDYAERGLMGFGIESTLDQEIYDDIQGHIDHWDGDGRVFRDCEYNYSYLFGIAADTEPDLYKDYEVVSEKTGE